MTEKKNNYILFLNQQHENAPFLLLLLCFNLFHYYVFIFFGIYSSICEEFQKLQIH